MVDDGGVDTGPTVEVAYEITGSQGVTRTCLSLARQLRTAAWQFAVYGADGNPVRHPCHTSADAPIYAIVDHRGLVGLEVVISQGRVEYTVDDS